MSLIILFMRKVALKNIVWKEGKHYVSWNLNTGISSFGDSRKEALNALQEALELHFEDAPLSQIHKIERPDIVSLVFRYGTFQSILLQSHLEESDFRE